MSKLNAIIAWWGALDNGGETIGDLFSLCRVARLATQHFKSVTLLSRYQYNQLSATGLPVVNLQNCNPEHYEVLIFVCGPIIKGSVAFVELINRFSHCRKIAIGVSVLPPLSPDSWNPFDLVLARDGMESVVGDVAFDPRDYSAQTIFSRNVGVCLRGQQREYGPGMSLHTEASDLVNYIVDLLGQSTISLDTKLYGNANATTNILTEFSRCRLVITTRLHGALLALALGIPTLAIDQVKGGAKLSSVCRLLGWSAVVRVDKMNCYSDIEAHLGAITQQNMTQEIELVRHRMSGQIDDAECRITKHFKSMA